MAAKDIEKLKEKFEKDPNSKLFLPLAEEYRKEGMLVEAIEVLQIGLEKHQAYTSARVLLGKIYLEKGMLDEARKEFENVIASVPDNLFAHKKLAEIYRETGESELAIKAFNAILRLNPLDDETLNSLNDLESVASSGSADQGQSAVADELKMPEETVSVVTSHEYVGKEISIEAAGEQVEHSEEELNAFKDSLFGDKDTMGDEVELDAVQEEQFEDEITIVEEAVEEPEQDQTFQHVREDVRQEESHAEEATAAEVEQAAEPADFLEDLMVMDSEVSPPESAAASLEDADRFVAEGKFSEAMGIYRKFLSSDPGNKVVLQRVEELRSLLKLLGKDKGVLIAKLDAFLEGINKRRDEFFRRP